MLFVSLPLVNSWHLQDGVERCIYGECLGCNGRSAPSLDVPRYPYSSLFPSNRQPLLTSTRRTTPCTGRNFKCSPSIHPPWCLAHTLALLYGIQIPLKTTSWRRHPCLIKWTCSGSFWTSPSGSMNASAYSHYGCVNWYEFFTYCSRTIMKHFLQLNLATSKGLHAPHDLILSSLPLISQTELVDVVESCQNLMSVRLPMIVGPYSRLRGRSFPHDQLLWLK